jgi:hypothetical protein
MVLSGRLATFPLRNITVGTQWFVDDEAHPSIRLRAERIDRPGEFVDFHAVGYSLVPGLPDSWDRAWYYRVPVEYVERLPLQPGCWRVVLRDGDPSDSVTFVAQGPSITFQVGGR